MTSSMRQAPRSPSSRSRSRRAEPGGPDAQRLQSVREIASLVNAGSDLGTIFDRIVFAVCHHTIWSRSGIMAVDRASGYSILVTRYDPDAPSHDELPRQWSLATSPSRKVVETKRPVVIEDVQHSDEFPEYREDAIARGYRTVVILPLGCTDMQGREMVLAVNSHSEVSVSPEELDFLMTTCHLAAIAVDKAKSLHGERMLSARLERTLELNSSLLERVLAGSSMQTIAGIVEAILPDQIVILDFTADSFHVGRSPDAERISDREWAELVRGPAAKLLVRLVHQVEPTDFRQLVRVDLAEAGVAFARDAYVEPLQVDSETVGGLVIFPRQRGLDELDVLIAQEAKFALSAQLMRAHIRQRGQASAMTDLFERLLDGAWSDARQIRNRATRLGIDLSSPAQLLVIDLDREAAARARPDVSHLLRNLGHIARQASPGAVVVDLDGSLLVFLPGAPQSFEVLASTLGRQLADAVKWQRGERPAVALGPVCTRPEDYPRAHDHCRRLVALARMFGRTGMVRQQDFGPFALLLSALDSAAVRDFVEDTAGRIDAYDREHGAELLRTASTFVDQGCRYKATADLLAIHVSTLRYRLKRLDELFGVDLEQAETRFALALALRLRAMVTSAGSGGTA